MAHLSQNINNFLKKQHIHVPLDWLNACLEWLQSENQTFQDSLRLQKQVYEQWLLTNLSELATPVLPREVFAEKCTLKGVYCLQINSIVNISQPLYGQLQDVQKKDNSNSIVSAETQSTQNPWENKPARMFLMKLTDGVTEVSGMEYRHINCLNSTIPPGCKVKLKGPFLCRQGVLLLSCSNLQLLGGEVEELFSSNNQQAILCRHLGKEIPRNITASNQTVEQQGVVPEMELPDDLVSQLTDDAFHTQEESGYLTCSRVSFSESNNNPVSSVPTSLDDPDDIDLSMLMEMERIEASQQRTQSSTSTKSLPIAHTSRQRENNQFCNEAVVDLTDNPSNPVQPKLRKLSKQLMIKESFNQNFKPLNDELQRCANKPLPCTSTNIKNNPSSHHLDSLSDSSPFLHASHDAAFTRTSQLERRNFTANNPLSLDSQSSDNLQQTSFPRYLCQIKNLSTEIKAMSVKGCVVTLLSKLQSNSLTGWCLKARICDGTGMLDVRFSNQVLTDLIGYSSNQAEAIKKSLDRSKILGLKTGMASCRDSIIEMCKLMVIKLDPHDNDLPIVIEVKEADHLYWNNMIVTG